MGWLAQQAHAAPCSRFSISCSKLIASPATVETTAWRAAADDKTKNS